MRRLARQAFFIVLLTLSWQVTTQASYTIVSTRLGAAELSVAIGLGAGFGGAGFAGAGLAGAGLAGAGFVELGAGVC